MRLTRKSSFDIKTRIKMFLKKYRGKYYAQHAEDLIMHTLLNKMLKKDNVFYLDIGAGDAKFLSNTWLFYKNGSNGICYEANENTYRKFKKTRERDIVYNSLVSENEEDMKFYEFDAHVLSTSDEESFKYLVENGFKVKNEKVMKSIPINEVVKNAFKVKEVDLLSIDIEGKEFELIQRIDLGKYRPKVLCIEVVDFETGDNGKDTRDLISYLRKKGYMLYANTKVNCIFVDKESFRFLYQ